MKRVGHDGNNVSAMYVYDIINNSIVLCGDEYTEFLFSGKFVYFNYNSKQSNNFQKLSL